MKFENVKIIENYGDLYNKKDGIFITKSHLLSEIADLQVIEKYESSLLAFEIPYVLAQVEVTVPHTSSEIVRNSKGEIELQYRYLRGYALFVTTEEINDGYHPNVKPFKKPSHSKVVKDAILKERLELNKSLTGGQNA